MNAKPLIGVIIGLLGGLVLAQTGNLSAQSTQTSTCQESKTIFQDVSRFGRKKNAAKNISDKHDEFTQAGWKFVDMETYIENSDLEGFFITYSRDIHCT